MVSLQAIFRARGYCRPWTAIFAVVAVILGRSSYAISPHASELAAARDWVAARFYGEGPVPFSFMYGGRESRAILPAWRKTLTNDTANDGVRRRVLQFADAATGLEVTCHVTEYLAYPAVEWVLEITNSGKDDSPVLHNILPLNTEIHNSAPNSPFGLRYALGSHERSDDFRLLETRVFSPAETLTFTSFGGRSSDGYLPFFNLMKQSGGVMLGVGWTGQWTASFRYAENGNMSTRAGMEYTHLKLHPGERIRTPAILLVFWDGDDPLRGHNLLRGLLRDHFTPRPGGQPLQVPLSISAHGTHAFEDTTEANMVAAIDQVAAHDTPFDTWWIDTGWFELINKNWARSVGNIRPDPVRYPQRMRPVADAAHRHGMKFLLWFEPERVMPDTWLHTNHRSWLMAPPSDLPFELTYMFYDGFHLLDLGQDAARKWLTDYTIQAIDEMGVDIYRMDFNMFPVYYWRHQEPVDRQGMNEIRYVTGLYRFWDDLLARFPNLLIDNCASGGRRIDFEMLRRSVPLFRSDVGFRNPTASQGMEWALSHWIPYHGMGAVSTDSYHFRSGLGAVFTVAMNLNEDANKWAQMNAMLQQYKAFRDYYIGDFYPLSPYELAEDRGIAWQFDRPDLGAGIVQAFRRQYSASESVRLKLRGLSAEADYSISDLDNPGRTQTISGSKLMSDGLDVALPNQPCAALITYRLKKK